MKNHVGQKGFTLLEVLVAVVLLVIGILGAASMQISSLGGNTVAIRITEATALATDRIEQFMALAYDDAALAHTTATEAGMNDLALAHNAGGPDASGYQIFWNVRENFPIQDCKTIRVAVQRRDKFISKVIAIDYIKMRL
jgi:type IV pilus modification protein PilV